MNDQPDATRRASDTEHLVALRPGSMLGKYRLESVLGHGGFGITYKAIDTELDRAVAIKEYLPSDMAVRVDGTTVKAKTRGDEADFGWGLTRFLDEAKALARFDSIHAVVRVFDYLQANGTAYMVMALVDGVPLAELYRRHGTLPEDQLKPIALTILDGLEQVHKAGFLHRDIKPGNILIGTNGSPVLIDFGAARQALGEKSRSITGIYTPGYAPFEQYTSSGKQGPWTDIYALAATLYQGIAGKVPPQATDRIREDDMIPAARVGAGRYSTAFLEAIDRGLEVHERDRPQSVDEWRTMLNGAASGAAPATRLSRPGAPATRLARNAPPPPARSRGLMIGGVAALVLALAGAAAALLLPGSKQPEPAGSTVATVSPAEEVLRRQRAIDEKTEADRKAADDARKNIEAQLTEARRLAEEARRQSDEARQQADAARQASEQDVRRRAEQDARQKAEAEAKAKAEAEAKAKAESDAKLKAEADAKKKAEDEARKKTEEAQKRNQPATLPPPGRRAIGGEELKRLFTSFAVERIINGRRTVLTYFPDGQSYSEADGAEVDRGTWTVHPDGYCVMWRGSKATRPGCLKTEVDGATLITIGPSGSSGTLLPRKLAAMPAGAAPPPQPAAATGDFPYTGAWRWIIDCPNTPTTPMFAYANSQMISGPTFNWRYGTSRSSGSIAGQISGKTMAFRIDWTMAANQQNYIGKFNLTAVSANEFAGTGPVSGFAAGAPERNCKMQLLRAQ